MRRAIFTLVLVGTAIGAFGCYGPDEAISRLAVTIRYASTGSSTRGVDTASSNIPAGAPFAYALDDFRVAAILKVRGSGVQSEDVPVLDSRNAATTGDTGTVSASVDVTTGSNVELSVIGFVWDGWADPIGFALDPPQTIYASGTDMDVAVAPVPMLSGTVGCQVTLNGAAVKGGAIYLVDQETGIAFPRVAIPAAGGDAVYDVAGVPLNRVMEMHYADAGGTWHHGKQPFQLTGAYTQLPFAL